MALNLTNDELTVLAQLVSQKGTANGEKLTDETPLNTLFGKLFDELYARNNTAANAAQVAAQEAEHAAKLAKLDAEYPVAVGDTAEVTIGKRTYRTVVQFRSEAPAGMNYAANSRQLALLILRKDGQPNKAMNGTRGAWHGLVRKDDIRKTA